MKREGLMEWLWPPSRLSAWYKKHKDDLQFGAEIVTLIGLIVTLYFTQRSLSATQASAQAAADSAGAAQNQIQQGVYQAVYQQQLDLWRLAAEHPERATDIIGGNDSNAAAREAAQDNALDFYAYVYAQLAPPGKDGRPLDLALAGTSKPADFSDAEWNSWTSWSYTIADGLRNNQALCDKLKDNRAYDLSFRHAVQVASRGRDPASKVCDW